MALLNWFRRQTGPNPDPEPGEGGYTSPRGPMGQTGYPGSTGQVRTDPPEVGGKLHDDYGGRSTGYGVEPNAQNRADLEPGSFEPSPVPSPVTRRGVNRAWVPFELQQLDLQKDPAEEFGGPNKHIGVSELGPGDAPGKARATERQQTLGFEGTPGLGRGVPGDANQRNTRFYAGKLATPDGENRYVFGGVNGGQDSYTFDARMPYTSRGNGARGADLDAERFYQPVVDGYFGDEGGQYGYMRQAPDGQHRPTQFYEPGPWTANFYDTTADAGSPDEPGSNAQAYEAVTFSPVVTGRRRG